MSDIDQIDFEIIAALRNNARITNKDLAQKVDLAPSSCLERVRYLRARGYIRDAHMEVNLAALGLGLQAMVAIRLAQHSRVGLEAFQSYVLSFSEVLQVYHLSGANDFMVHIAVKDAETLRDFVLDSFAERPEVAHIETAIIYQEVKNWQLAPSDK
ncbi:AsnC family transcriptional regulator [Arenicella chitinivorans]|uniref:AsnC family transcriptional regulator n=1 Tax=Arenicella chitinivorans TaxID=1329800 RepID=A0A918RVU7_9GAMM|nr:Lrp/AsnC family transcriptional regulator [Arenicella chitinivorans]GHA10722.1 AsnC family transcriptional regulator [Arenicella chitinivorans]